MERISTAIIGAGLSGLTFALELGVHRDLRIFERSSRPGGLSSTQRVGEFAFDWTGHWFHVRDDALRERVLALTPMIEIVRRAEVWFDGRYMPYPFQLHLGYLSEADQRRCARGLDNLTVGAGATFASVLRQRFGDGIYELFLEPYNHKIWGVHPRDMSGDYALRYLPTPDIGAMRASLTDRREQAVGYNQCFLYPKEGGMGHLAEAMVAAVGESRISLGEGVARIAPLEHRITLESGAVIGYDRLVYTGALPDLGVLLHAPPEAIASALARLHGRHVQFLDLGISPASPKGFHWCYVPERRYPFYRVGVYSNAAPHMAPRHGSSLYVEMDHVARYPDQASALRAALPGLLEMGVISSPHDVRVARLRTIPNAYAVPDQHYEAALAKIFEYCSHHDMYLLGRFGRWNYSSMGEDMIRAASLARECV